MINKKYAILLAMSFISFAHGAASSSSTAVENPDTTAVPFDTSAMQTTALFRIETVQLPDDGLIHMPFLKGHVSKSNSILNPARRFRGYVGFASGPHEEGVRAMANAAGSYPYTESVFDSTLRTKQIVIREDSRLLAFIDKCEITERCLDMNKYSISSHPYFSHNAILPYPYEKLLREIHSARTFETIPLLVAAIKGAAEGICALAKKKNPDIKLVHVPMLVRREGLRAFHAEMFPPRAK